jgi:hypothetical protein
VWDIATLGHSTITPLSPSSSIIDLSKAKKHDTFYEIWVDRPLQKRNKKRPNGTPWLGWSYKSRWHQNPCTSQVKTTQIMNDKHLCNIRKTISSGVTLKLVHNHNKDINTQK